MFAERTTCRLCTGRVRLALSLTPTPIANSFPDTPNSGESIPLQLAECEDCGHVQIRHVVADSVLYSSGYKYRTPAAEVPRLTECADRLFSLYRGPMLEIGSNNGTYLHILHSAGFKPVIGVDPGSDDPLVWKWPFGISCARHVVKRVGKVGLIVANNVFAHINDLNEIFFGIDICLADDGAVVFEVQYFPDMVRSGAFDMIYHEHRDYHTLRPLARFARKHGFVLTEFEHIGTHGGSIRVTLRRDGETPRLPDESIDWRGFEDRILAAKDSTIRRLVGRVAAFGATAKACTLIHHFGLADRISYCVDETPQKQGRYIAGTGIKVVPSFEDKPDSVLLTAWNYAKVIAERFPDLLLVNPFENIGTHSDAGAKETVCAAH